MFVFLGEFDCRPRVAVKQPAPAGMTPLPLTTPAGDGLGRAGRMAVPFGADDDVPVALVREWMAPSCLTVAPKAVRKALGAEPARRQA